MFDHQSCCTLGRVSTSMGDFLQAGKPGQGMLRSSEMCSTFNFLICS